MVDTSTLVANERYKAMSSAFINAGTGLLAAAVVKAYLAGGFGFEALLRGWGLAMYTKSIAKAERAKHKVD